MNNRPLRNNTTIKQSCQRSKNGIDAFFLCSSMIQWVDIHEMVYGRLGNVINDSGQGRLCWVCISLMLLEMIGPKNYCNYCNFWSKANNQMPRTKMKRNISFFLINTEIIVIPFNWILHKMVINYAQLKCVCTHFQHLLIIITSEKAHRDTFSVAVCAALIISCAQSSSMITMCY